MNEDKTIRVWEVSSGRTVRVIRPPLGFGSDGRLFAVALSPDGSTLAVSGYGYQLIGGWYIPVYLIDLDSGLRKDTLSVSDDPIPGLSFSADGNILAVGTLGGAVHFYDLAAKKWRFNFTMPLREKEKESGAGDRRGILSEGPGRAGGDGRG